MRHRLMISVAAIALVAGAGFANAQGGIKNETGGAATQQTSPSNPSTAAPAEIPAKPTQSEQKRAPGGEKGQRAEDNAPSAKSKSMSSETEPRGETKGELKGGPKDMKAESREGQGDRSQMTTGQAAGGAKLSSEQRTKITTVIRNEHVAPANNVNFSIAVGTRVPREGVSLRPLPSEVVTIYPQWRGYEFILVRDQILVIDPGSFEIVAILPA